MNPTKEKLDSKLQELEGLFNINEHDIVEELKALVIQDDENKPCPEFILESSAFSFMENSNENASGWGTYFGPLFTWKTEDGSWVEGPSITKIDEEAIKYWESRTHETKNPILKARYSGLVWDFSEKTISKAPHYSFAEICCCSLIEISERDLHKYPSNVVKKLERALSLAISLNNPELIDRAKNAILNYERKISEVNKPGLWGFSFDLLVNNNKVDLSQDDEDQIILDLEDKLEKLEKVDPWACEKAAERLIHYYSSNGRNDQRERVIKVLGISFEESASNKDPLVASALLDHIYQIYSQYGLSPEADQVSIKLNELGPKVVSDMKEVSVELKIPLEEIEEYVSQFLDGDLEVALKKIAFLSIPQKDMVQDQLMDLVEKAPLTFQFSNRITDHDGHVIAILGPISEDLEGHIASQMSQSISFNQLFLSTVFDRVIENYKLDPDKLLKYLLGCPLIKEHQHPFLLKGIQLYFSGDYLSAVHVLIPQIELIIRNMIAFTGGAILKRRIEGGFQYLTLGEMLRNTHFVSTVGENIAFYLQVVLTDQRGWNLRNNICHGLSRADIYSKSITERIIQIIILLAQLRNLEG